MVGVCLAATASSTAGSMAPQSQSRANNNTLFQFTLEDEVSLSCGMRRGVGVGWLEAIGRPRREW